MRNTITLMLAFILLGAGALQGCASTAAQCTTDSCKQDAQITAALKAKLKEHRELGPPNSVYVQTRDGVVYLTGQVATDLQRSTAESLAETIPGVVSVVNSIALTFGGR
jgi:osmotically-inducible protein OsmY